MDGPPELQVANKQALADATAQPADAYLVEQATLESLREGQHKDVNGNVISKLFLAKSAAHAVADSQIADPDLSNPTRPRLERPLDTIRSFEKAIDNGYKRRSSMVRGGKSHLRKAHPTSVFAGASVLGLSQARGCARNDTPRSASSSGLP